MSNHSNKNKALQYMQLMKEYDQGDSLYDDTTYDIANSTKRIENGADPTFSVEATSKTSKVNNTNQASGGAWYSALVNDAWDVVQKSVETSDHVLSTAWNTVESLGNNVASASGHRRMPSQTLHSQGSSTNLVFPQSKEALMMIQQNNAKDPPSDSPEMRQQAGSSNSSSRAIISQETRQPPAAEQTAPSSVGETTSQPTKMANHASGKPASKTKSKPKEPKQTREVQKETKELAAKKRAALAKKKGAANISTSYGSRKASSSSRKAASGNSTKACKDDKSHKASSSSVKASGGESVVASDGKSTKVNSKASKKSSGKSMVAKSGNSTKVSSKSTKISSTKIIAITSLEDDSNTVMSGPRAKKITQELPGTRQDPPGAARAGVNDDATVAPFRSKKAVSPAVSQQVQLAMEKYQQQPKSIVRRDLEEQSKQPLMALVAMTTPIINQCTGAAAQERTTSPLPVRPCDIPRGSDIKKRNESILPSLDSDFFTSTLKQFGF